MGAGAHGGCENQMRKYESADAETRVGRFIETF